MYTKSSMAMNQLSLLDQLYRSNKNIAEGEGADLLHSVKSWAKTIGIDLGKSTSLEDVVSSITTEMALKHRTAGGSNLLPGQMSNYEDKLLQSMQPGLTRTREGRLMLIDFMKEIYRTNIRFAEEATKYERANKRLDPGWYDRQERITEEEMTRLAVKQREIRQKYLQKGK
jgi:hypothetical protein